MNKFALRANGNYDLKKTYFRYFQELQVAITCAVLGVDAILCYV